MSDERKPREHTCVTLFAPGRYASLDDLARGLGSGVRVADDGASLVGDALPFSAGLEWTDNPRDGSFGEAFSFATCSADEIRAIDAAGGAAVLELPVELHTFRAEIAAIAAALRDAGALAFRIEQSKLGFAANAWMEMIGSDQLTSLYRLAVVTLRDKSTTRTLGMHAFSLPDIEIEATGREASSWLDPMALFQIDEDPVFGSGHTFTPDTETPRRVMEWWPDTDYPIGHVCNNPFGVYRLGASGTSGRPQSEQRPTFIPALRTVLEVTRTKKGAPLTTAEIEHLRDEGICMMMEPRHARELERARGFADIDPERAVECWTAIESMRQEG